ncbi:hypothetical protein FJY70_06195 [candidate division WOR-3 bacterium]|nr:hypothetical protein [candidate division WOR-3 bacterium]
MLELALALALELALVLELVLELLLAPATIRSVENPLDQVIAKDPRFRPEAYLFVHEAIGHAWTRLGERRHVTGRELCDAARDLARRSYGAMAKTVLNSWGVRTTDDFGAIVYGLIDAGLMSKTDEDRIEDFHALYDFDEAFVRSYDITGPTQDA